MYITMCTTAYHRLMFGAVQPCCISQAAALRPRLIKACRRPTQRNQIL